MYMKGTYNIFHVICHLNWQIAPSNELKIFVRRSHHVSIRMLSDLLKLDVQWYVRGRKKQPEQQRRKNNHEIEMTCCIVSFVYNIHMVVQLTNCTI